MQCKLQPFFLIFLWSLIAWMQGLHAKVLFPEMATLIVSYQIEHEANRLDRIRFWLINEQEERTLYPKRDEFVSNNHTPNERTVVITHLPAGHYRLEFLIPNCDRQYEEVLPREINLAPGAVVRIDQVIHPRLHALSSQNERWDDIAFVTTHYEPPFYHSRPQPSPYARSRPLPLPINNGSFSLTTNHPDVNWKLVHHGRVIFTGTGSMTNLSILPGSDFNILAEQIDGYSVYTSPEMPLDITPGQNVPRRSLLSTR